MLTKKEKCNICKTYRADRFCMRKAVKICWHCCNELRADSKCPKECKYTPQIDDGNLKLVVFSQAEFNDFFEREADFWAIKPNPDFENKTPFELLQTKEGRDRINEYFKRNKIPNYYVAKIYKEKFNLDIDLSIFPKLQKAPEDIAIDFMNYLILQDKEKIQSLLYNPLYQKDKKKYENYYNRLFSIKIIKKMKRYDVLASAFSQDRKQATVHFEINGKYDFSVNLKDKNGWKIKEVAFATLHQMFDRKSLVTILAEHLSNKNIKEAYEILKEYKKIFFDYPDFYYYYAQYYAILGQYESAVKYMERAVELDSEFIPYQMDLSNIYILSGKYGKAIETLKEILKQDENDIKALNNLANLYAQQKDYNRAKELYEQCLKLNPDFPYAKDNLKKVEELLKEK